MVCIVCPIGCKMTIVEDVSEQSGFKVTGNKCPRGVDYGVREMTNPTRPITTTVKIQNGILNRLPVRTNKDIPKEMIFEVMKEISKIEISAPIKAKSVIVSNILGTGADIIASRSMD